MKRGRGWLCLALTALAAPLAAATPNDIVAQAPASAWKAIDPHFLIMLTLEDGRQVAIQLTPRFAPIHVANIVTLVRAGWFDGAAVTRVQDNYVVQWARPDAGSQRPAALVRHPPAEYERPAAGLVFRPLGFRDSYAAETGHVDGWPVAREGGAAWLVHCYGMVGVGRDMAPDTGDGTELYAVIGQAPRHLDRNIALVGRIVEGMEWLSARPRGTGPLGFYKDEASALPIRSAKIAADLPAEQRPRFEVLDQTSPAFAQWIHARANRKDDFFVRPAGAVDVCNASTPVRRAP
ncbi:peptidylprolyl isomerase [Flavisphingomonas formosensis]|uniref:peptidylprolyl isomerase n=1 Tax=Flavisphingomonas formosensis TaxID=861534 RepID=UPI0012FC75B3|nr:peptidylprolyl isomerase [Sphingomonas formosensis]